MLGDFLRAACATACIAVAGYVSTNRMLPLFASQSQVAYSQQPESAVVEPMLEWAMRQGGALAVLMIVLYFYRRDWKTAVDFWKDQNTARDTLVKEATKAQVEIVAALRESTVVIHSLKRVIEAEFPERRSGRELP